MTTPSHATPMLGAIKAQRVAEAANKNHAAFIWSVADPLRGDDKPFEYGNVILPLFVPRGRRQPHEWSGPIPVVGGAHRDADSLRFSHAVGDAQPEDRVSTNSAFRADAGRYHGGRQRPA